MTKYGLCIGINNYPGTQSDLTGCVNDARDWAHELTARGFRVATLLDGEATKAAIVTRMRDILDTAVSKDVVVFTYSGHGTWQPDADGDEADGRDEALCPYDIRQSVLVDDELYDIFSDRHRNTRLIFISDSCHSGSVARFAMLGQEQKRRVRYLPPAAYMTDPVRLDAARSLQRVPVSGRARSSALLLSGAQDFEYSWDTEFAGRPNGAFTRVALDVLKNLPASATYRDWHRAIRSRLPSMDYPQTPNLEGTSTQKNWPLFA